MDSWRLLLVMLTLLLLAGWSAHAQDGFDQPAPGSRERRAILDAIRPRVEAAYRKKVKFSVRAIQSNGRIALLFVEPLDMRGEFLGARVMHDARGKRLDLDGWVFAIVKKGPKGWQLAEIDLLDETDGLSDWQRRYPEIPEAIFEGVGVLTNAEG